MSRAPRPGHRSALCRAAALAALTAALLALAAGPAGAHGGGEVADGSNYDSRVTAVLDVATGAAVDEGDLRWRVLANDALLELRNRGDAEVVVSGYEGEPYLRIGPDGVFENVASPASILNDDRYGLGTIPPGVSAAEEPRWKRLGSEPTWRWHDHRIHWMATTAPPQVKVDPQAKVEVLTWEVPYSTEGQQLAVGGELWWVPPPPPWPWLAAAVVGLGVPLALGARRTSVPGARSPVGARRVRVVGRQAGLLRAAAGLSAAVGLLTVARAVDDIVAFPAPAGADALVLASAFLLALPALAVVPWVRRAGTGAALAVAAGAAILALGNAAASLAVLSTSQVASSAPAAARLVSALVLALALPAAVALAIALLARRAPDRRRAVAAARCPPSAPPAPVPDTSTSAPAAAPPAAAAGSVPGMLVPRTPQ